MTTSADVRARLTHALRLDLIGPEPDEPPAGEVLPISPSRFYLTGFLAPLNAPASQKADDDSTPAFVLMNLRGVTSWACPACVLGVLCGETALVFVISRAPGL